MLLIAAPHPDTVLHALRDLLRHTRGAMQPRWRVDAFGSPAAPVRYAAQPDGLHGRQREPDSPTPARLVGLGRLAREPAWTAGGSYQVVRVIRMFVEFWDRVGLNEQERMIGRRRDTGAPLAGSAETDAPDYRNDPIGNTTPLDRAHPDGEPADTGDRQQPDAAPGSTTTAASTRTATSTWGWCSRLPERPGTRVRAVQKRLEGDLWWTTSRRSVAVTSSRYPASETRRTVWARPALRRNVTNGPALRSHLVEECRKGSQLMPRRLGPPSACALPPERSQALVLTATVPGSSAGASHFVGDGRHLRGRGHWFQRLHRGLRPARRRPRRTRPPIKHVVVIFDENISFDHYFGTYPERDQPGGAADVHARRRHAERQRARRRRC